MSHPFSIGFIKDHFDESIKDSFDIFIQNNKNTTIDSGHFSFKNIHPHDVFSSLISGETSAYLYPMSKAPYELPEELIYFAITRPPDKKRILVCKSEQYIAFNDLKLKDNTTIGVIEKTDGLLLKHLNHEIQYKLIQNEILVQPEQWAESGIQAILTCENDNIGSLYPENQYNYIPLHPDEFPESFGSDRWYWLGHREAMTDMVNIRNVFHHPEEVQVSNIERLIHQNIKEHTDFELRVRCSKDVRQNYHIKSMVIHKETGTVFQHSISQSTHFALAEKSISVLKEYIQKEV